MADRGKDDVAGDLPLAFPSDIPTILVDGYQGVSFTGGVVRFNMWQVVQMSPEGDTERQVVLRLVMGMPTLFAMHEAMGRLIRDMAADGTIKVSSPEASKTPPENG